MYAVSFLNPTIVKNIYIYQDSVDVKRQMYIVKIHKHKKDDQYVKFVSRGRCEPNLSGT